MLLLIRLFLLSIGLVIFTTSQATEVYSLIYVYDGDTVKLQTLQGIAKGETFKLRLTDIDAPELDQAYGMQSRQALMQLCQGDSILVTATLVGRDQYQRTLGRLQCNHIDVSLYLVERGLAWHSAKFSHNMQLSRAARQAKSLKISLWADDQPIPPWVWRHRHAQ